MGKIYDLNGNEMSSSKKEDVEETVEQEQEKELKPSEQLYAEYVHVIQTVVEKTLDRAEIQNVQMDQQTYMKILSTANQICMMRLMRFLSEDIGIDDIDMIFDEKTRESLNKVISFEKNVEKPTEEDIKNLNKQ